MFKSSLIPLSFSLMLMLFTVSGSGELDYPKRANLYNPTDKILVAAHRGIHSLYPENSIPAIEECIRKGIDIVEIDIRETKDKIPVLIHDPGLQRTTNNNIKIADLDYEELKNYPLLFGDEPTEYIIPSLEQALQRAKNRIILNLDYKLDDLLAFERAYDLIAKYEMEKWVIITLNDLDLIPELYKLNPEIRIMPVAFNWLKINKVIDHEFLDIIQVYHRPYSNYRIHQLEKNDLDIWVNALRKYDKMEKAGDNGFEKLIYIKKVDVIQTDYPEELLGFLRKKGLHD